MAIDVLVAGRVYVDLLFAGASIPSEGGEAFADGFEISPGGAANRAVAAARLGGRSALLAQLGTDPLGSEVAAQLAREAVDLRHCEQPAGLRAPVSAVISTSAERSFVTYLGEATIPAWRAAEIPHTVHIGLDAPLPSWIAEVRARGSYVVGGIGWDPTLRWDRSVIERATGADALVVNETEALSYTATARARDAVAILADIVPSGVVTLGAQGALGWHAGVVVRMPGLPVEAVDPTGAGDVFVAGFLTATAWGWSFPDTVALACAAAACSVTRTGGAVSAPCPAQIADLLTRVGGSDYGIVREWSSKNDGSPQAGASR